MAPKFAGSHKSQQRLVALKAGCELSERGLTKHPSPLNPTNCILFFVKIHIGLNQSWVQL